MNIEMQYLMDRFQTLGALEKIIIAILLLLLAYIVINALAYIIISLLEIVVDLVGIFCKAFRKHFWAIIFIMILIMCYFKLK
jgi:hypothetical protein